MKVVNIKREPYTHYIGRGSFFGNIYSHQPSNFPVIKVASREEAIASYENNTRSNQGLLDYIRGLPEDAVLGCFCAPLPCHGDIIIKLWKEMHP